MRELKVDDSGESLNVSREMSESRGNHKGRHLGQSLSPRDLISQS